MGGWVGMGEARAVASGFMFLESRARDLERESRTVFVLAILFGRSGTNVKYDMATDGT